jgi:hypothetical protein
MLLRGAGTASMDSYESVMPGKIGAIRTPAGTPASFSRLLVVIRWDAGALCYFPVSRWCARRCW